MRAGQLRQLLELGGPGPGIGGASGDLAVAQCEPGTTRRPVLSRHRSGYLELRAAGRGVHATQTTARAPIWGNAQTTTCTLQPSVPSCVDSPGTGIKLEFCQTIEIDVLAQKCGPFCT